MIRSLQESKPLAVVWLKTALVFLLSIVLSASLVSLSEGIRLERARNSATEEARGHVALIQQQISHGLALTYAIATLLRAEGGQIRDFPAVGAEILRYHNSVSSIQLAPGGVVRQIVPLEGNESAIGHDLLKDENRTKEAFLALQTRQLTLAGPFELIQGGQAVVGRLPAFLPERPARDARNPGDSDFWGFVGVLIKLDSLLTSARLNDLAKAGYQFELWRKHPDTGERHVFLQSSSRPLDEPRNINFEVPNGQWTLSIAPAAGWQAYDELAVKAAIAVLVSGLIAALGFLVFKQPLVLKRLVAESVRNLKEHQEHLEERVKERTAELTRLTEQLRQRSDEQEAIFESATSGIVLFDRQTIIRCNRRMYEIFAWPEGRLIGLSPRSWYPDDESFQQALEGARANIKQGKTHTHEQLLVRYDETTFWVRMTGRAIDPSQPERGSVWIYDDITAERDALQQIIQARQSAEEAARGRAIFLANMSHEIRTPMNAILGFSALLRRDMHDANQLLKIDRISTAGKHLLGIINDILDLSKIEAGKLELVEEPVDLHQLTDDVVAMLAEEAEAKGIALRTEREGVPRFVQADPVRLTQALLNLASNAVKFTSTGSVVLRMAVVREAEEQVLIRFSVIDTGIGIAPEVLPLLFSPFQQADSSTTRRFGGTGLGLSITHRLAQMMGGEAGATSEVGAGSTFWFTGVFPMLTEKAVLDVAPARNAATNPAAILARDYAGTRVLLVEDDLVNQVLALEWLGEAGLTVDTASNGIEAVERVRRASLQEFALILMDMQMPEMDGLQATRIIRTLPAGQMPIIAMTANSYKEDRLRCEEAGMDDFVSKPVDPEAFFATLLKWMTKTRARHAPSIQ